MTLPRLRQAFFFSGVQPSTSFESERLYVKPNEIMSIMFTNNVKLNDVEGN